jgi:hypothetical protein
LVDRYSNEDEEEEYDEEEDGEEEVVKQAPERPYKADSAEDERQPSSSLPANLESIKDPNAFYTSLDIAVKLVPRGYRPLGPYQEKFHMRHRTTKQNFVFKMPRDRTWFDKLKDRYFDYFPSERDPEKSRPHIGGVVDSDEVLPALDAMTAEPDIEEPGAVAGEKLERYNNYSMMLGRRDPNRPILRMMIDRSAWLHGAIYELGFDVMFAMIRASAKSGGSVDEWYSKLESKDGFNAMCRQQLTGMLELYEHAENYNKMRKHLLQLMTQEAILRESIRELEQEKVYFNNTLQSAVMTMCDDDRNKFLTMQMLNPFISQRNGLQQMMQQHAANNGGPPLPDPSLTVVRKQDVQEDFETPPAIDPDALVKAARDKALEIEKQKVNRGAVK